MSVSFIREIIGVEQFCVTKILNFFVPLIEIVLDMSLNECLTDADCKMYGVRSIIVARSWEIGKSYSTQLLSYFSHADCFYTAFFSCVFQNEF